MLDWAKILPVTLAISLVLIFGAVVVVLIFHPLPRENENVVSLLAGALGTNVGTIIGYYFGSSRSSAAKDATVAALVKQVQP